MFYPRGLALNIQKDLLGLSEAQEENKLVISPHVLSRLGMNECVESMQLLENDSRSSIR